MYFFLFMDVLLRGRRESLALDFSSRVCSFYPFLFCSLPSRLVHLILFHPISFLIHSSHWPYLIYPIPSYPLSQFTNPFTPVDVPPPCLPPPRPLPPPHRTNLPPPHPHLGHNHHPTPHSRAILRQLRAHQRRQPLSTFFDQDPHCGIQDADSGCVYVWAGGDISVGRCGE